MQGRALEQWRNRNRGTQGDSENVEAMNSPRFAIDRLARLQATLHELSLVPRRVAEIAAPKIDRELRKQFDLGVDPYGNAWAPLAPATIEKGRQEPPLTDTNELRDGTRATVRSGTKAGIQITVSARYGFFHQTGFRHYISNKKVPARRILPQFGMPARWRQILREAAKKAFRETVRR